MSLLRSYRSLFAFLALWSINLVYGQNISIQAKLDRAQIKTGEQAAIDITIRTNDLSNTRFYLKEDASKGEQRFQVLEFGALDTIQIDGTLQEISARMLITSFDSTLITIPSIVVESPSGRAESQPLALNVVQPVVDLTHPNDFKAIKQPWDVELRIRDILEMILSSPYFWIILLLLVIAYAYYHDTYLTKKETKVSEPIITPATLSERMEQAFKNIEEREYLKQGAFKEYYSDLVSLLKGFVDELYDWSTNELTSSELLNLMQSKRIDRELIQMMTGILREADLSKFAKSTPSEAVAEISIRDARSFVRLTLERWQPLVINKAQEAEA